MSFAKPTPKQESSFDEEQKLICSVPGCPKRWTVHLSGDRPKCSEHQWAKDPAEYRRPIGAQSVKRQGLASAFTSILGFAI